LHLLTTQGKKECDVLTTKFQTEAIIIQIPNAFELLVRISLQMIPKLLIHGIKRKA